MKETFLRLMPQVELHREYKVHYSDFFPTIIFEKKMFTDDSDTDDSDDCRNSDDSNSVESDS